MKSYLNTYLIIVLLAITSLSSCNKYYEDSGIHSNNYDGTVVDYIKGRKDIFDSLYRVIQLSGLEGTLNKQGVTFFAPGDPTIRKSIYALNNYLYGRGLDTVKTLSQVDSEVWRDFLSMYIYNNTYLLKDIPQLDTLNMDIYPGQSFVSIGNHDMNLGVLYNDVTSGTGANAQIVQYAGYRQLYISKIRNIGSVGAVGSMINSPVATSDIKTNNGVIHALQFQKHVFGFNTADFVTAAYSKGIKY